MDLSATNRVGRDSSLSGPDRQTFGEGSLGLATIDPKVRQLVEQLIAASNAQLDKRDQPQVDPSKAQGAAVKAPPRDPSSVTSLVRELVKALKGQASSGDVSDILSRLQKAVAARDPNNASAGTKTALSAIDQLRSALNGGLPNKIDGSGAPRLASRDPLTPSGAGDDVRQASSTGDLAQVLGKLSGLIGSGDKDSIKAILSDLVKVIASLMNKLGGSKPDVTAA